LFRHFEKERSVEGSGLWSME